VEVSVVKAKELIKTLYMAKDRESILLLGPAGIGKSEVVKLAAIEIANELGKEFVEYNDDLADELLSNSDKYFVFVDIRLTEVEPSDLIGFPREEDGCVVYKPLKWGRVLQRCAGILFLDEITNVQRLDVQAAMYKLLLDRKVGFVPLNKDVLVIAAGNRPEDSSIAVQLPAPAINRVKRIKCKAPTLDEWINYMNMTYNDWDRRVAGFLKRFSQYFIQTPDPETLEQFATPRKWTKLALISHKLTENELEVVADAEVGPEAAAHFMAFVKIKIPEISEILKNPRIFAELEEEQKYFAVVQMSSDLYHRLSKKQNIVPAYRRMLLHLNDNDHEMLTLLIMLLPWEYRVRLLEQCDEHDDLTSIVDTLADIYHEMRRLEK
jgi:MoxR-like ATPase